MRERAPERLCLSRSELADALSVSETQVDELVRRGILPRPIRLGGCVRWTLESVRVALASLAAAGQPSDESGPDARDAGDIKRAIEAAKGGRRGRAA